MPAMIEAAIVIGECECDTCGRAYDFERDGAELSDQCPECQAREEEQARIAEERDEAIADAQSELEEAESDLDGLLAELAELRERIAESKAAAKAAKGKLARLTG